MDINLFGTCLTNTKEHTPANNFSLYPNPTSNQLMIQLAVIETSDIEVRIYDILGKKVAAKKVEQSTAIFSIPLEQYNLAKGIYHLELSSNGKWRGTEQFVVQ